MKMEDANKLIYEKSNKYRLHADILRWALLGGYAAFFGATIQIAKGAPGIGIILSLVAFLYLIVLGVQNWFYNLFALFVKECETRLVAGEKLRPLEEFAQAVGSTVNPFHPAFFFAMLVVVVSGVAFLSVSMDLGFFLSLILVVALCSLFKYCFKRWNDFIYEPLIKRFSNLFKQGPSE